MKNIILILVVIMSLGCNLAYEIVDENYESKFEGHTLYNSPEFNTLETLEDVSRYFDEEIKGVTRLGYQEPKETMETKEGNCTSFSIAYLNALYFVTGIEANIIAVDYFSVSREVVGGGFDSNHAVVELPDGTQIEPQTGDIVNYDVLYRYDFDVVF